MQAASPTQGAILSHYSLSGQVIFQEDHRKPGVDAQEHIYLAGSLVATRHRNYGSGAVATKYQHTDALGSPVAVTDEAGQVVDRTHYEPFGAPINKTFNGVGYTGHVMDAATGLVNMQQRYYDPGIGRFLSVDPVTSDANLGTNFNRYWYANNNPYRFTDPDGRIAVPMAASGCAATGPACPLGAAGGYLLGRLITYVAAALIVKAVSESDDGQAEGEGGETKEPIPGAVDLEDDLAGQELIGQIEAGGGKVLEGRGDKKFDTETGSHDKVAGSRKHPDGTKTELHGERNRETGKVDSAKIKQDAANSRGNREK